MPLLLLGVNHRNAPVELRERLVFSASDVDETLVALALSCCGTEAAVLSTCNRAEVYVVCESIEQGRQDVEEFLAEMHRVPRHHLTPHLHLKVDTDAVRHLFRVAAGLDSMVVGEPQILGQVKQAYAQATAQRLVGPLLNRLFAAAFGVGKRVRSETSLSEGPVSIASAAVTLAGRVFGGFENRMVLVVGAGEMGKRVAQHLKSQGASRIFITSRTAAHSQRLAEEIGTGVRPWEHLSGSLAEADIVITATGAKAPIISQHVLETVVHTRGDRPLFLIDIAVPRDVDPAVGTLDRVFLSNIDDLEAVVAENHLRRNAEVHRAEAIVSEEVSRFCGWMQSRRAIPTVVALRRRFEVIRRSELQRLRPKLAVLPADARIRVEEITRLIIEKLLITPSDRLKALPDDETVEAYSEMLTRLFNLTDNHRRTGGASVNDDANDGPSPSADPQCVVN